MFWFRLRLKLGRSLVVDHELQQLLDVGGIVRHQLQFLDLAAGERLRERHVLRQLGLQIQAVALVRDEFNSSCAGINGIKQSLNIFNVCHFHVSFLSF